uniref:Replication termination factor 2 n=1 Tax=Rhabditophanes sp. KR3021 TaxID=114890 RepID=A0AC35TQP6_9BILA
MGADGGTIPKRCELVKTKKRDEKIDKNVVLALKWKICQLTQEKLRKPVAIDKLGRLYNKEALFDAMLSKSLAKSEETKHIKKMKDIKEANLTDNNTYVDKMDKGGSSIDHNETQFMCPVTSLPMNGFYKFFINWKCGCVFSEKAVKEVQSDACHVCGGEYHVDDLIVINPDDATLAGYKQKINESSEKSSRKRKDVKEVLISANMLKKAKQN